MEKKNYRPRLFVLLALSVAIVFVVFRGLITDYISGMQAPDGIYMPNSTYNFNNSPSKSGVLKHTFRIYNLRPRRLSISVETNCDCTGVSWERATIIPFGWKDISATMEASEKSANPWAQRSVGITFLTDSRTQPFLSAYLMG